MAQETQPMVQARVSLNEQLELVSAADGVALCSQLTPEDALGLARELVHKLALIRVGFGTPFENELQDHLSQAFAWIENSRASLAKARLTNAPTTETRN